MRAATGQLPHGTGSTVGSDLCRPRSRGARLRMSRCPCSAHQHRDSRCRRAFWRRVHATSTTSLSEASRSTPLDPLRLDIPGREEAPPAASSRSNVPGSRVNKVADGAGAVDRDHRDHDSKAEEARHHRPRHRQDFLVERRGRRGRGRTSPSRSSATWSLISRRFGDLADVFSFHASADDEMHLDCPALVVGFLDYYRLPRPWSRGTCGSADRT